MKTLSRIMWIILAMTLVTKPRVMMPLHVIRIAAVLRKVTLPKNAQTMEDSLNVVSGKLVREFASP